MHTCAKRRPKPGSTPGFVLISCGFEPSHPASRRALNAPQSHRISESLLWYRSKRSIVAPSAAFLILYEIFVTYSLSLMLTLRCVLPSASFVHLIFTKKSPPGFFTERNFASENVRNFIW